MDDQIHGGQAEVNRSGDVFFVGSGASSFMHHDLGTRVTTAVIGPTVDGRRRALRARILSSDHAMRDWGIGGAEDGRRTSLNDARQAVVAVRFEDRKKRDLSGNGVEHPAVSSSAARAADVEAMRNARARWLSNRNPTLG